MPATKFPIYLFLAEENFLKEEAVEKLRAKFLDKNTEDLNYSVFYGSDTGFNAREMLDNLNTMPFLSKKRLVVLKDADSLAPHDKKAVISYLDRPKESSVFVMESSSAVIKGGFLLEVSKRSNLFYFRRLMDSDLNSWLVKRAAARGKRITAEATHIIKGSLPNDLTLFSSAMETIILYTGNRTLITKDDVEQLVGMNPSQTAFDLIARIENKDARNALAIFSLLKRNKKKETELLGLMAWNARMLLRIKELLKIRSKAEMRNELGLNPRRFEEISRHAAVFKKDQIVALLAEILAADLDIKSGLPASMVMERLIVKMCS